MASFLAFVFFFLHPGKRYSQRDYIYLYSFNAEILKRQHQSINYVLILVLTVGFL